MGWAVKKDGSGWRAVDSKTEINKDIETYSENQPALPQGNEIKNQILALESTITPRRIREAVLGQENPTGWLANIEAQIVQLREQLT